MPRKRKSHPGLAKARRVRKLMAEGYTKTEARKKAGVKGTKKRAKKSAKRKTKKRAKKRARR